MSDNQQPSPQPERQCKSCGEMKPLEDFAPVYSMKNRGKEYRQHTCLPCHRAKHAEKERKRRAENPQRYREVLKRHRTLHRDRYTKRKRDWYDRVKKSVFDHYGWACSCCGETAPCMLNIDHINNDGGEFRKAVRGMRWSMNFYAWIIDNNFPTDLQVLCYNCNLSKHRNGGVCAHRLRGRFNDYPVRE